MIFMKNVYFTTAHITPAVIFLANQSRALHQLQKLEEIIIIHLIQNGKK